MKLSIVSIIFLLLSLFSIAFAFAVPKALPEAVPKPDSSIINNSTIPQPIFVVNPVSDAVGIVTGQFNAGVQVIDQALQNPVKVNQTVVKKVEKILTPAQKNMKQALIDAEEKMKYYDACKAEADEAIKNLAAYDNENQEGGVLPLLENVDSTYAALKKATKDLPDEVCKKSGVNKTKAVAACDSVHAKLKEIVQWLLNTTPAEKIEGLANLVIAGVTIVGQVIVNVATKIHDAIKSLYSLCKEKLKVIWGAIVKAKDWMLNQLYKCSKDIFNILKNVTATILGFLKNLLKLVAQILGFVGSAFLNIIKGVGSIVAVIVHDAVSIVQSVTIKVAEFVVDAAHFIAHNIIAPIACLVHLIISYAKSCIKYLVGEVFLAIANSVKALAELIVKLLEHFLSGARDFFLAALSDIGNIFIAIGEFLKSFKAKQYQSISGGSVETLQ